MVNRIILQEQIPGIDWFVPYDYQASFIAELLDVYNCYGDDDIFDTEYVGVFHEMTPDLAGLHAEGDVNFYYCEAERLYQTDDDRHEYIHEIVAEYSEDMEEVVNKTLDYFNMTYQYRSMLIRHYAKEVW